MFSCLWIFFFLFKLMSLLCRIKFYTQEIVLFRQDLLYRMRRSSLIPPSTEETSDPFEHVSTKLLFFIESRSLRPSNLKLIESLLLQLVATITHQSHLCPLPLTVQPIIWNYDHCLRLYPTPHTVFFFLFYLQMNQS